MQATITYCLTEAAQRAQMASTGQPVARKQTITVEVPAEDLEFYPISVDGTINVNLAADLLYINNIRVIDRSRSFSDAPHVPTLVREAVEAEHTAKAKKRAELESGLEQQLAGVERFMADTSARIGEYDIRQGYAWIGPGQVSVRVDRTENESHLACPRWNEMAIEAERRNAIDAEAKRVKDTESARKKAEKEAAEELKETAKLDFLRNWISENGSESQKARSADDLLCREEAIRELADATFATANAVRYTRDSAPRPDCTCEDCRDDDECGIRFECEDKCDCLSEPEYDRLSGLKRSLPDTAVYILRTRTAIHDCDHTGGCAEGKRHTVMAKITVGPFTLQREYAL